MIPSGYTAVPLEEAKNLFSWRFCILVQEGPPAKRRLVSIANLPDARAFLGCVLDAQGNVRQWVQVWAQDLTDLISQEAELSGQESSTQFDRRWKTHWKAVQILAPETVMLDVDIQDLRPLHFDSITGRIVSPTLPDGREWVLCREDELLAASDLKKYSETVTRYLTVTAAPGESPQFSPANQNLISNDTTATSSPTLQIPTSWLPVNPQGGHLAICQHPALDLQDFASLLGGAAVAEVCARKTLLEAVLLRQALTPAGLDGRRHGLLLTGWDANEVFFLKLRLIAMAGRGLLTHLREHQTPLLNLDPSSFAIYPGTVLGELPWPWTTACHLTRPGRAIPIPIPEANERRYVAVGDSGAPAFCPAGLNRREDLGVTVNTRVIKVDSQNRATLEGTLQVSSPLPLEPSDLVRFRLSQGPVRGDFFAKLSVQGPAAQDVIQFTTWPKTLTSQQATELKRFQGGKFERCWCQFVTTLSSPYDLYSFSRLGAQVLLVHEGNSLAEVVSALERLGRRLSKTLPSQISLSELVPLVQEALAGDEEKGPLAEQHLLGGLPPAMQSGVFVSKRHWAEVISILIHLTPRLGGVSRCSDYGDAPAGGIHIPLEEPLQALENLSARVRSSIFLDWQANQEIHSILDKVRGKL